MFTLLTILSKGSAPYWNMWKRKYAEDGIAPLTIAHVSNLIGHPIGIAILIISGFFILPLDPLFYLYWFSLIGVAAIVTMFTIYGLLETKFFTTQVIGSLKFVSSSILAVIFLHEKLNGWSIFALVLGVIGVIFFSWDKKEKRLFAFDKGMIFTIIAVILSGFSSIFYKLATLHVGSPASLFTGRFIADLIGWTLIWVIVLLAMKKNPLKDLNALVQKPYSKIFLPGDIITTFLDSWLVYMLPVITISVLGTIAFPVTYFISYFKYKERITASMWLGTLCIASSIIIFLLFK